jgi:hypothetical protein
MQEYEKYQETGNKSARLEEMLYFIQPPKSLRRSDIDDVPEKQGSITCLGCRAAVNIVLNNRRKGKDKNYLTKAAIKLCKELEAQPDEVCEGIVPINMESLTFIVDSRPELDGNAICSLIFQDTCGGLPKEMNFVIDIDPNFENITVGY